MAQYPEIIIKDFGEPAQKVIRRLLEVSYDTGTITGYGTEETGDYAGYFYIEDSSKNWPKDVWKNLIFEDIDKGVVAKIVGNSSTRLYLDRDISANISTGDRYRIGPFGTISGAVQIQSPLTDTGNVAIGIAEDLVGLAKESTLSSIDSKIVKVDTDNVKIVSPLTANGNVSVSIAEDSVGLAKESTLSGIKAQTDKLTFTADNFLRIDIASDSVGILKTSDIPKSSAGNININLNEDSVGIAKDSTLAELRDKFTVVYASGSISASDNTAGFSVTLNKGHRRYVDVYFKLGGAGDLIIEVSVDGSNWRVYHSESFSALLSDDFFFFRAAF